MESLAPGLSLPVLSHKRALLMAGPDFCFLIVLIQWDLIKSPAAYYLHCYNVIFCIPLCIGIIDLCLFSFSTHSLFLKECCSSSWVCYPLWKKEISRRRLLLEGTEVQQIRQINSVGQKLHEHFKLPWDRDTAYSMSPVNTGYSFTGFGLGCLVTQPLLLVLKPEIFP